MVGDVRRISGSRVLMLGAYALFLALIATLTWDAGLFVAQFGTGVEYDLVRLVPPFAMPLTLLVIGVASGLAERGGRCSSLWGRGVVGRPQEVWALAALLVFEAAGCLLAFVGLTQSCATWMRVLISLLLGVGNALVFALFQHALSLMPLRQAGFVVIGAATLSAVVYLVTLPLSVGLRLGFSLVVIVPVCLGLCVAYLRSFGDGATASRAHADGVPIAGTRTGTSVVRELVQPLVCITLSAFIVGIFNAIPAVAADASMANIIKMAGLAVSGIALFVVWDHVGADLSFNVVYRMVFPLVATVYLISPVFYGGYAYVFVGIAYLVFSIVSALMVLTCLRVAEEHDCAPVTVYGVFAGIVYLFLNVGALVGQRIGGSSGTTTALLVIALVVVYVLGLAGARLRRLPSVADHAAGDGGIGGGNAGDGVGSDGENADGDGDDAFARGLSGVVPGEVGDVPGADSVESRCATLQERFGLSMRETEVCALLARGRDVPSIANILGVSKNTVRTHMKNLYAKIGVHTKQELIDKLDEG